MQQVGNGSRLRNTLFQQLHALEVTRVLGVIGSQHAEAHL